MAESLLRPTGEGLVLRIRGGPRDGQRLKIRAPKCSIGSSPGCTLRLRGAAIRPIHCTILRGRDRTVVRRGAIDTRLNGALFDDALLNPGDLLGVGPLEFEVLPDETVSTAPPALSAPAAPSGPPAAADPQARRQLETERQALDQERRLWVDQHRAAQAELDHRQSQLDQQRTLWDEQCRRAQAELEQRQAQFEQQRTAWDDQRHRAQADLDRREAQLEERQGELVAQQQAFHNEREAVELAARQLEERQAQLTAEQEAIGRQRDELEQLESRLSQQHQALEQQRQSLESQQQGIAQKLDALDDDRRDLDSQRQQSEAERDAWQQQCQAWELDHVADLSPQPAGEATPSEPDEGGSVLSTARFLAPEALQEYESPQDTGPLESPADVSPPAAVEDEEQSVEDYMRGLMQRVSGRASSAPSSQAPPAQAPPARQVDTPVQPPTEETTTATHDASAEATSVDDVERTDEIEPPRTVAPVPRDVPEMSSKIAAMRDLANLSARSAIAKHQRRSGRRSMFSSLLQAAVAITSGSALLLINDGRSQITLGFAAAAFCLGAYYCGQCVVGLARRAGGATWTNAPSPEPKPDHADMAHLAAAPSDPPEADA